MLCILGAELSVIYKGKVLVDVTIAASIKPQFFRSGFQEAIKVFTESIKHQGIDEFFCDNVVYSESFLMLLS